MREEQSFFKSVCGIALPVTLQSVLQSSFSVADQIMIGQLGSISVAGIGLAGKFVSIYSVLVSAVAAVAGIMISQYMGKKSEEGVNRSFSVNLLAALGIAVLFTGICIFFPETVMGFYTQDPETAGAAAAYLRIAAISCLPVAGTTLISTMLRCMERAALPLYAGIGAVILNTALNYVLIFGKCGLPAMGVRGAALATVTAQIVNFAAVFLLYRRNRSSESRSFRLDIHLGKAGRLQYAAMLLPILVTEFFWSLGENVYAMIYGHMGTADCAAMTLTNPVQGIMIGILSGLSQAAGIIIGKSLGGREYDRAYREAVKLMLYGLCGSGLLSVLLLLGSRSYVELYQVEEGVKQTAVEILRVYAVIANVKVQNMILGGGIIRSGGKTKYVMVIDLIGTWCFGVPLGLLAAFGLRLPIPLVYLFLSLEECVRLAISVAVFRKRKWMKTFC